MKILVSQSTICNLCILAYILKISNCQLRISLVGDRILKEEVNVMCHLGTVFIRLLSHQEAHCAVLQS